MAVEEFPCDILNDVRFEHEDAAFMRGAMLRGAYISAVTECEDVIPSWFSWLCKAAQDLEAPLPCDAYNLGRASPHLP